jgi:PAS domain S-box-containing protein
VVNNVKRSSSEGASGGAPPQHPVLEASPNPIVAIDADGAIAYVNPQAVTTFGYPRDEILGHPVELLLPDRVADRHVAHRSSFVANPVARPMGIGLELAGRRRDGSEFPVEIGLSTVETANGPLTYATIVDVTARKAMEAQLRQSQKMEVVGQLAGGIAHDFNNVLMAISGYCELWETDIGIADGSQEYIDGIKRAAGRATELTRQLLAFSRLHVVQTRIVDLNTVVRGVEPMVRMLLGEAISLTLDLEPALPSLLADENQLEQVIVNLAANARDAMPRGGALRIETRSVEVGPRSGRVDGLTVPAGRYDILAVGDTGTGMDAETSGQMFEPFFTTKPVGQGTGLGLSMVYGSVVQAGGDVRVRSEVGLGTTVEVYLPQATGPAELVVGRLAVRAGSIRSRTILLVEDDDEVRTILQAILETAGHSVIAAGEPGEAIRLVEAGAGSIDLLLTDVVMPGMSGPELASRLRARLGALPVLFMSSASGKIIAGHGVLQPGVDLLNKPFTTAALLGRIEDILEDAPDTLDDERRPA